MYSYNHVHVPEMSKITTVAKFVPIITASSVEPNMTKNCSVLSATESSSIGIMVQLRNGADKMTTKSLVFA